MNEDAPILAVAVAIIIVIPTQYVMALIVSKLAFAAACPLYVVKYNLRNSTIRDFWEKGTRRRIIYWFTPADPRSLRLAKWGHRPRTNTRLVFILSLLIPLATCFLPYYLIPLLAVKFWQLDADTIGAIIIGLSGVILHMSGIYFALDTARELLDLEKQQE